MVVCHRRWGWSIFSQWDSTHNTWSPDQLSQRVGHWISNTLLVVPIRFFLLHTIYVGLPWLYRWLVALLPFFKIKYSVRRFCIGLYYLFDLSKNLWKGGRIKERTIGIILRSAWGSSKNLKSIKWSNLY